jgi:hypothetical protein
MKALLSLTSILITLPITVCASCPGEVPPQNIDFHYPKIGVLVVPPSELQITEDQKIKIQSNMLQIKAKGYYDSDAPDAKFISHEKC